MFSVSVSTFVTCVQLEARSVCHLQSLNKGLELKIMELQCRLIDQVRLMGIDILTHTHTHK